MQILICFGCLRIQLPLAKQVLANIFTVFSGKENVRVGLSLDKSENDFKCDI